MRILLTGTTGKLGGYLAQHWSTSHEVLPVTRAEVDLTDTAALESFLQGADYDLLVNPAALSTPEGCEANPEIAEAVNVAAPGAMARICAEKGVPMLHFSTDYVLAGESPGFKDESAATGPNNLYGDTKLRGEEAVLAAHPDATIARVSWVFGSAGEGFLEKVFRQIRTGEALEGVADKYSLPTSAREMARALDLLIAEHANGVFHLTQTAEEPVSWHRYAEEVALAVHEIGLTPEIIPVSPRKMVDIPALATNRPIHTAMTPARLEQLFHHRMRPWQQVLQERVRELASV